MPSQNQLNQFPTNRRLEFKGFFSSSLLLSSSLRSSVHFIQYYLLILSFLLLVFGWGLFHFAGSQSHTCNDDSFFFYSSLPVARTFFFEFSFFHSFSCLSNAFIYRIITVMESKNAIDELEGNVQLDGTQENEKVYNIKSECGRCFSFDDWFQFASSWWPSWSRLEYFVLCWMLFFHMYTSVCAVRLPSIQRTTNPNE